MSITSPIEVELQHSDVQTNDIQIVADDIIVIPDTVLNDAAATVSLPEDTSLTSEPLFPFLILGTLSLLAILAVAVLLAL